MYTMTLNKKFEIVDCRPGKPDPSGGGRQFEMSEKEFKRLKSAGELNGADGLPRWRWDSNANRAVGITRGGES